MGEEDILEEDERGETLDGVHFGERIVGRRVDLHVNVSNRKHLGNVDLSIHLVGQILPGGGQLLAVTAPLRS